MKNKNRMRELTLEIIVGAFLFIVLLALSLFTIVLSRERFFASTWQLEVVFNEVMGLRDGDNVVMRGMTIGKVKSLALRPDGVHLHCQLDQEVQFRKNYSARIISSSILGGRYLQIDPGPATNPPLPPEQMPLRGLDPVDLMDEAAAVVSQVRQSLNEGQILSNLEVAVQSLREISEKVNSGKGTLGMLINDDTIYADARDVVADIKEAVRERKLLAKLEESAENIRDISDKINSGEGTLGMLVNDSALYDDAAEIVREVRAAVQQRRLLANLEDTVANLEAITDRINRGEGTAGKFINDDALYEDMSRLVNEARAALDDLRELSPIGTFSSVLFGAF